MKILMVKQFDNSFKVAFDSDYEKLKRIKPNEVIECEIKKKRNIMHLRKTFALFNLVYQNQELYSNIEDLRHDISIEAGYYETHKNLKGEVIKMPKSISFASMDQHAFNEYYDAVINVVVKYFHFEKESLINEVSQYF